MSEGINVRLQGRLREFVKEKSDPERGTFSSASEYIRDLIRHDYEAEEKRRWAMLRQELAEGMSAEPEEFESVSANDIIEEARRKKSDFNGT